MPETPFFSWGSFLCMGLFSIFLVGSALGETFYSAGTPVDPRVVSLLPAACFARCALGGTTSVANPSHARKRMVSQVLSISHQR